MPLDTALSLPVRSLRETGTPGMGHPVPDRAALLCLTLFLAQGVQRRRKSPVALPEKPAGGKWKSPCSVSGIA